MCMSLSNPLANKLMKTTNSIAAGFPTLDVGESVGWEELKTWPLDYLFV